MRLKQHDKPLFSASAQSQRGLDLRWMMTIIIYYGIFTRLEPDFESAPGAAERFKRLRNLGKRHVYLRCQRHGSQCIADVVSTWNSKG